MPLAAQAKRLHVLETREVFPIVALRSRRVDLRIVAAAHGRLEQAVRTGRFRADLYYRHNVARVELQPLRQHDWPGNARELRNMVEAASIVCEGEALQLADLPLPTAASECGSEPTRILEALERCERNRSKAAALLHWSRMTLYRKMKHGHVGPV